MREIVIFVHGVSSDTMGRRHDEEYNSLYEGVRDHTRRASAWRNAEICRVEWGWNFDGHPGAKSHRILTQAQTQVGGRLLKVIDEAFDPTINPGRLIVNSFRPLLVYGFSDMFYYVSTDGKAAVRGSLAEQVVGMFDPSCMQDDPISLTFVGHSAGSVIVFDFCFYLFAKEDRQFVRDPSKGLCNQQVHILREMALSGRLRVRRLITMGSPISMLACRNDAVVELLALGERIDPAWYGLTQNPETFGDPLRGARWINIWDKDDPIAFPVEPLMRPGGAVKDEYVNVSSNIVEAHNAYWTHGDVHETIARLW